MAERDPSVEFVGRRLTYFFQLWASLRFTIEEAAWNAGGVSSVVTRWLVLWMEIGKAKPGMLCRCRWERANHS